MTDFEIKITADTSGVVAGGKQAASSLSELGKTGAEAGKQITEETKKATGSHGEFKKVVNELTREFPLLGAVGRAAISPIGAAAAIGAMAFGFFRQKIAEVANSIEMADWKGYGEKIKGTFEAGKAAAAEMADQVEEISKRAERAKGSSERLMDVFKARMTAEEKLDEARKKYEVAGVEAGGGDPVAKRRALLEIEERYAGRQRARADEASRFQISEQARKLGNMRAAGDALRSQVAGMKGKLGKLGDPDTLASELSADEGHLGRLDSVIEQNNLRLDQLQDPQTFSDWFGGIELDNRVIMKPIYAQQRALLKKQIASKRGRLSAAKSLSETIGTAETNLGTINEQAEGIAGMLPTQVAVAGIERQSRQQVGAVDIGTRMLGEVGESNQSMQQLQDKILQDMGQNRGVMKSLLDAYVQNQAFSVELQRQINQMRAQLKAGARGAL